MAKLMAWSKLRKKRTFNIFFKINNIFINFSKIEQRIINIISEFHIFQIQININRKIKKYKTLRFIF